MPAANLPIEAGELPDSSHESAPSAVRERRESEQLITDWERERRRLGHALAVMALDVSAMTGPRWAHRFVIAVSPAVDDWSFLFYGAGFASLMELPEKADRSVPMVEQLPARYLPVFTHGGIASTLCRIPVRVHGAVEREDGGRELYRAAFIRLNLDANREQHFALGTFNCRPAESCA